MRVTSAADFSLSTSRPLPSARQRELAIQNVQEVGFMSVYSGASNNRRFRNAFQLMGPFELHTVAEHPTCLSASLNNNSSYRACSVNRFSSPIRLGFGFSALTLLHNSL